MVSYGCFDVALTGAVGSSNYGVVLMELLWLYFRAGEAVSNIVYRDGLDDAW